MARKISQFINNLQSIVSYLKDGRLGLPMVFWLNTSFAEHVKGFYSYAFVLALNHNFKEMVDVVEIVPEKPTIGKAFKKEGKIVMDYLAQMDKDSVKEFEDKLNEKGWE